MIFGANRPLSIREMRRCLVEVAEEQKGETVAFGGVTEKDIAVCLEELQDDLVRSRLGFILSEVDGGFRLQSEVSCGKWLKHLLDKGQRHRLSRPGLETLAIIACRQPVSRAEIEAVRGVSVDHVVKALMEMQLVRIIGRSKLPGRPFLYGTTHTFLDHFGLRNIKDLREVVPLDVVEQTGPEAPADSVESED